MIADGPVDLPRVGRSLPIRNVPEGQCTYACVYCCLGGTAKRRTRRRPFRGTDEVVAAVRDRLARCDGDTRTPDYLTFVHGGEPTLDSHLGVEIDRLAGIRLAGTRVPVAVMTNASLLWRPDVRSELLSADRVVVKVDTVDPTIWRRLNRPGRQLRLRRVLSGLEAFGAEYRGRLDTVTTLVPGLNDADAHLQALRVFLEGLGPTRMYRLVKRTATEEAP
jgi:wyosine [tRNA(Phe)-imidazoG37] synthetase (radical SAM superfamily)